MESFVRDVRYGLPSLRKAPGFHGHCRPGARSAGGV